MDVFKSNTISQIQSNGQGRAQQTIIFIYRQNISDGWNCKDFSDDYEIGPTGRLPEAPTTAEVSLTWLTVVASALFVFSGFDGSMGVSDASSLGGH